MGLHAVKINRQNDGGVNDVTVIVGNGFDGIIFESCFPFTSS